MAALRSMRPPPASTWPRFSTSPCGAVTRTARCGSALSTRSTLRPAASSTWPPGASIRPSLRTLAPPTSITRPPATVRNWPWLTTLAWLNRPSAAAARPSRPAAQSASRRLRVDAIRPATSTRAFAPNSTPLGLSNQTVPLLLRLPRIWLGSWPSTRFSTRLLALGCSKRTAWPAPIENCCQFSKALAVCVTVICPPWVTRLAWPCTTCRPLGSTGPAARPPAWASRPATASARGRSVAGRRRRCCGWRAGAMVLPEAATAVALRKERSKAVMAGSPAPGRAAAVRTSSVSEAGNAAGSGSGRAVGRQAWRRSEAGMQGQVGAPVTGQRAGRVLARLGQRQPQLHRPPGQAQAQAQ